MKIQQILVASCALLWSVVGYTREISNPVIPGDFSDPGIFRVGDDYYGVRSTFGWQPGLQIIHSKDLQNWEYIGHAFKGDNDVTIGTGEVFGGIWGSDMIYNPNTDMYLVYAPIYSGPKEKAIYVFASKNPEGPYSRGKKIIDMDIDPGVFVDTQTDNQIYLSSKASVIYRLSKDGMSLIEKVSRVGSNDGKAFGEGAEIIKKGDYYYYTCSEGGTLPYEHHKVLSFRSKSLKGPWEADPQNPLKYSPHTDMQPLQGPGHGELICTPEGAWYITYHAYEIGYPTLARQMCLEPVTWTKDGWWRPNFGKYPPVKFETNNLPQSDIKLNQSDEFNSLELGPMWYFHTKPDYSGTSWSLQKTKGSLTLNNYAGERNDTQTLQRFVMQTLVGKEFEFSTKATLSNSIEGEIAGLLMYVNTENYIQYGLSTINGKRVVAVRLKYGPFNRIKRQNKPYPGQFLTFTTTPFEGDEVHLKIKVVNPETAHFFYSKDGKEWSTFSNNEIFFGRGGTPDLGWQHTYWTGATIGMCIDSQKATSNPSSVTFDYFRVTR